MGLNHLICWYFKKNSLPYWCILLLDMSIVMASGIIMFYLFRHGMQTATHFWELVHSMFIYTILAMIGFRRFHTYSGIFRYSSFVDLKRVGYANLMNLVIALVLHYPLYRLPTSLFSNLNGREIIGLYFIATVAMWAVRVLVKELYDLFFQDEKAMRALIYGVLDGGVMLAKSIRTEKPKRFDLKGFISNQETLIHHNLMGVRVFDADDSLKKVIEQLGIEALLVAPQRNQQFRKDEKLQNFFIDAGVKIFMIDEAKEWVAESMTQGQALQEVSVEDLLPRSEIKVDMEGVARELTGKRIMITGAAGSIGSEIVRQVALFKPAGMMLIDQAETPEHDVRLMMEKQFPEIPAKTVVTSITKMDRMEKIFKDFRPDYVFHAAAYKHVPMMEDNPCEAVQNNVLGTKVIADLSVKYGVKKFVMVSTDKAVNPTNVMGCSKRICEIYVQSLNKEIRENGRDGVLTQFVTTRFGNVLGSNGSVIPLFREQLKHGGPLTVTHPDIIRFFMLIPEACKLVLEAGTKGNGGEIFVFDMGKPVRIADLAERMIKLSGATDVEIKYTGLRPGEKLYEEVLNELEGTKPSFHEKIRIASVREYDYQEVNREIQQLIDVSWQFDDMETVKIMKRIVPEFKSNNSVYDVLDK